MRHISLLFFLLLAATAIAQPEATWLERSYDLGIFKEENGKVHCAMRVVNTGNEPLLIVKAMAGCGCTGVDYPESPIQPGDTAAISITYDPSGRPGEFTKQIMVNTNTIPRRTILEFTGTVIPTAQTLDKQYPLQAGSLHISQRSIPFGELVMGENKTLFLSCYNASTDTLLIFVSGGKEHLIPALVPDTVPPARVAALTVHYLSKRAPQWGLNTDTLTLRCEPLRPQASASGGTADVYVMAQVLENFDHLTEKELKEAAAVSVDCGDSLDFGTLKAGETATRTFSVTNKGKSPLAIRRLWVPESEGVTLKADRNEVKRGKSATVTVTVDTSQLTGDMLNVPLTLICNDPQSPRQTIRLVGIIDK